MATKEELVRAAFLCADGSRHDWDYLKDLEKHYRCRKCLTVYTKARLKELTDHA